MQSSVNVKVSPSVLFSVMDHEARRQGPNHRVIGMLFGVQVSERLVEVRSAFPVHHVEESGEDVVLPDSDSHHSMVELHENATSNEVFVGWYATGSKVDSNSMVIHSYYAQEVEKPIHLFVNTSMDKPGLDVKSYISVPLQGLGGSLLGAQFVQVQTQVEAQEPDTVGVNALVSTLKDSGALAASAGVESNLKVLQGTMGELLTRLEDVAAYVRKVADGKQEGKPEVGRFLLEALSQVPQMSKKDFDEMFNAGMQDLLMVVYLSNVTRTQLVLADKLHKTL